VGRTFSKESDGDLDTGRGVLCLHCMPSPLRIEQGKLIIECHAPLPYQRRGSTWCSRHFRSDDCRWSEKGSRGLQGIFYHLLINVTGADSIAIAWSIIQPGSFIAHYLRQSRAILDTLRIPIRIHLFITFRPRSDPTELDWRISDPFYRAMVKSEPRYSPSFSACGRCIDYGTDHP